MAESSTITREGALMTKVPDDHPLMIAWKAYTATTDYETTKDWAYQLHIEGSLWAAFERGFMAASVMPHPNPPGGPVANPEGERLYSAYVERSRAEFPEERAASSLEDAVRFIERWMPDSLPASDTGQVPFGRALLEMALDSMKAAIAQQRPDSRVDTQVWAAARSLDEQRAAQPEWLWFAMEDTGGIPVASYSYGRWAKVPGQAPFVRADIALDMMGVERFACAARRQGTIGGNDPADCDWPSCGCDPYADKVIAALQESGALATGGAR